MGVSDRIRATVALRFQSRDSHSMGFLQVLRELSAGEDIGYA